MDFSKVFPPCAPYQVDSELLSIVQDIEQKYHITLKVNSAYRTFDYEKSQGRDGSSAHCFGKALDIATPNSHVRYDVVKGALERGIHRIGIYKNFVHLDIACAKDNKPTCCVWYG